MYNFINKNQINVSNNKQLLIKEIFIVNYNIQNSQLLFKKNATSKNS